MGLTLFGGGSAGGGVSDAAVAGVVNQAQTKAALSDVFAAGKLPPAPLTGATLTSAPTTPHAIEKFGGYLWGYRPTLGNIYRSADGVTWATYCAAPSANGIMRIIPTADGEVIVATVIEVWRSTGWGTGSPTWTKKLTANGTATFNEFNVDGYGLKFIATQYGSTRADSRYGHVSLDGGATWSQVWDSTTKFGATLANQSHIHGACYDRWSDRFYIAEGHDDGGSNGDIAGIYWASAGAAFDTTGTAFVRAPGMVQNPSPTVLCPTDDGLVCGSDHALPGTYGVIRQANAANESIRLTAPWNTGTQGVMGSAVRGVRDDDGTVYIGYQPAAGSKPIITGGFASTHALLWESATAATSAGDRAGEIIPVGDGTATGDVQIAGVRYVLRATLGKAGAPSGVYPWSGKIADGTSTAVGRTSSSVDRGTVTIGENSRVTAGFDAVVIGKDALGDGSQSITAVGKGAQAGGNGVSVGTNAKPDVLTRVNTTVVGSEAKTTGNNAVSVGYNATSGGTCVALGYNAAASGGTALGSAATASHGNAVALGNSTATTATFQVAVGARAVFMLNIAAAPATPTGGGVMYVEGGALKFKGSSGTVTTIAPA